MKTISHTNLSNTLAMSECNDGFWLYDKTRGMNLAMRAKTSDEAFTEALTYYQKRLSKVEADHAALSTKVGAFVAQFQDDDD